MQHRQKQMAGRGPIGQRNGSFDLDSFDGQLDEVIVRRFIHGQQGNQKATPPRYELHASFEAFQEMLHQRVTLPHP